MKLLILFVFLFGFSTFVSAEELMYSGGFFDGAFSFFNDIWHFITVVIPETIDSFFVWLFSYLVYLKFYFIYTGLVFSHSVAVSFLDMVNITGVVQSAVSALPSDLQQVSSDIRFFDSLTLVIEACITKFVYEAF